MQALANLAPAEAATLILIVLAFCAFGVTLFAVSLSVTLSERARAEPPKAEVTPARRVSTKLSH